MHLIILIAGLYLQGKLKYFLKVQWFLSKTKKKKFEATEKVEKSGMVINIIYLFILFNRDMALMRNFKLLVSLSMEWSRYCRWNPSCCIQLVLGKVFWFTICPKGFIIWFHIGRSEYVNAEFVHNTWEVWELLD